MQNQRSARQSISTGELDPSDVESPWTQSWTPVTWKAHRLWFAEIPSVVKLFFSSIFLWKVFSSFSRIVHYSSNFEAASPNSFNKTKQTTSSYEEKFWHHIPKALPPPCLSSQIQARRSYSQLFLNDIQDFSITSAGLWRSRDHVEVRIFSYKRKCIQAHNL